VAKQQGMTMSRSGAAGPRGIGTAVAFDWAIAAELALYAVVIALGVGPGADIARQFAPRGGVALVLAALAALLAGAPLFALGEALRRGRELARRLQILFNAALFVAGLILLPEGISGLARTRRFGGLTPPLYMIALSGVILWQLTRPQTHAWFGTVSSGEARRRHGGARWLLPTVLIAIVGGTSVTFDSLY
jgi:hypothetical protein